MESIRVQFDWVPNDGSFIATVRYRKTQHTQQKRPLTSTSEQEIITRANWDNYFFFVLLAITLTVKVCKNLIFVYILSLFRHVSLCNRLNFPGNQTKRLHYENSVNPVRSVSEITVQSWTKSFTLFLIGYGGSFVKNYWIKGNPSPVITVKLVQNLCFLFCQ